MKIFLLKIFQDTGNVKLPVC